MKIAIDKYVRGAPKDFFYVMVRDAAPPKQEGIDWTPDAGVQPPPTWMTGIFGAKLAIGSVEVELSRFEKGTSPCACAQARKSQALGAKKA